MADETTPEQPAAPKKAAARKPAAPKTTPAKETTPAKAPAAPKAPAAKKPAAAAPDAAAAAPESPATAAPVVPTYVAPPADPAVLPPAPRKRKIWPLVVGGAILVFLLAVVGIVFAILSVTGALTGGPQKTVLEYDRAFKEADCDLFLDTLSQTYEDTAFGGQLDCAAWTDNAKTYTIDGEYVFTVAVTGTTIENDQAQVTTHETDVSSGEPVDYDVRYYLVREDGDWVIDNIADESE